MKHDPTTNRLIVCAFGLALSIVKEEVRDPEAIERIRARFKEIEKEYPVEVSRER